MATKTFYFSNVLATGASVPSLNESNAGISANNLGGWDTGLWNNSASAQYSMWVYSNLAINNVTSFGTTDSIVSGSNTGPGWSGLDYIRTETTYTGTFASGTWAIDLNCLGSDPTSSFHIKLKAWRSTSATGASPTAVGSAFEGATPFTPIVAPYSISWSAPSITLSNEYLFFQFELHAVSTSGEPGTSGSNNVNLRASTVRTWVTTDFTAGAAAGSLIIDPNASFRHLMFR